VISSKVAFIIYFILLDVIIISLAHRRGKKRNLIIKEYCRRNDRLFDFSTTAYIKNIFFFREIKLQSANLTNQELLEAKKLEQLFKVEIFFIILLLGMPFYAGKLFGYND